VKTIGRWHSERLHRQVTMVRWGTSGQPLLLFPTAGGDAEEVERMHLIGAIMPLIEAGRIKVYSCDSVAGAAMLAREGDYRHLMWLQDQFHRYVRHEVVPAIRTDCQTASGGAATHPDDKTAQAVEIWTAGASIGAFHAVASVCRFPDVFARACAMSGTYDLLRFFGTKETTDEYRVSSPLHFVPTLDGIHLEKLRTRFILLISGEGRAEDIGESWRLAHVLGQQGIPNRVESWGPDWPHDWQTWRKMLPKVLAEWTEPRKGDA
jgi:esterase/lipase superfamily enzyme